MTAAAFLSQNTGSADAPVLTAQAAAKGDLVGLSAGNVVRAEDTAWNSTLAATQADFAKLFVGAAKQTKTAAVARVPGNGSDNIIRVATAGVVTYDCASADFKVGDLVGPAKQSGSLLESQKVVAVAYERLAIGRVFRAGTALTRVRVQLLSALKPEGRQDNTANPDVAVIAALTDNGGGASADGTIAAVTAPTALTDSTGGTADNTVSPVGATNSGDVSGVINNNFKELVVAQAVNRAAIVALTDAVKELSTKVNEVVAALKTANIVASS